MNKLKIKKVSNGFLLTFEEYNNEDVLINTDFLIEEKDEYDVDDNTFLSTKGSRKAMVKLLKEVAVYFGFANGKNSPHELKIYFKKKEVNL